MPVAKLKYGACVELLAFKQTTLSYEYLQKHTDTILTERGTGWTQLFFKVGNWCENVKKYNLLFCLFIW